jgi:serine/threonine protein kinase
MNSLCRNGAGVGACFRAFARAWPRAAPLTFGPYHIRRQLGGGGFGIVCLADDPQRPGPVALKIARPEVAFTLSLRGWLRREAIVVGRLDHAAIPPLVGVGSVGPIDYLATAYFPAPTLAAWLAARGGTAPPRTAARIARELAAAVGHAHDRGVVHCDLTPANVLVADAGGTVRLIDFGMARFLNRPADTPRGLRGGTHGFAAPEQLRNASVGPPADVYGVGAVLYTMLAGRPPGSADRLPEGVPTGLAEICLTCLATRPDRRYSDAAALGTALDAFLASRPKAACR